MSELLGAALVATIVFVDWDYDGSTPEVLLHLVRLPDLAALGYVFATVRSVRGPLAEWGWRHGRGVCRELSIGILAGLILRAMDPLLDAVAETDASAWRTRMVLGTVLLAPIIEETLYRGALYRYLRDRMHWLSTAIFSATVFALVHSFPQMHTAYVMGLACALLREWRGSLIAPVAMHASWNLLAMAASGLLTD